MQDKCKESHEYHFKKQNTGFNWATSCWTLTFAGSSVRDLSGHVSVKALLAVVAVASCSVVAAVHADPSTLPPWQLVQLHVEATTSGVEVAVARCEGKIKVNGLSCQCSSKGEQNKSFLEGFIYICLLACILEKSCGDFPVRHYNSEWFIIHTAAVLGCYSRTHQSKVIFAELIFSIS